eukprot:CAMPEP_0179264374 /NCGR_PEP_ID=MMETSP0797-20121207/28359_1 /TAXON_ID=47934 /ORGANISM="Dinophysis acuminata, Strain DAEP01" /LENGTH=37 /DNA_ID= /DNA_START= /DNA_END= /DNA_ORIENTATION=
MSAVRVAPLEAATTCCSASGEAPTKPVPPERKNLRRK